MKQCTLVIPDAGPFNSLWVADQLPLLLALDMPIIVLDAVYGEMTKDTKNFQKDRDVKNFIDQNQPPFVWHETEIGQLEYRRIASGEKPLKNAGDFAIAEFMAGGIEKYVSRNEPVLVLFEDSDINMVRFFRKPPNLHLLSTIGLIRGLERAGVLPSADAIIREMTHPTKPGRRPRAFKDLPDGIDDPAVISSAWTPPAR